MIRALTLMGLLASVGACAQYREPSVDCFPLVAAEQTQTACDFEMLGGPETTESADA